MIDEHKLLRDAERAAQAQALLDNALLNELYAAREVQLIAEWKATRSGETDKREQIWYDIRANSKHKDGLISIQSDGKLAAVELRQLAEANERKKKYGVL